MEFLYVVLISAMPILELRAGLPLAIYLGFRPAEAYMLSIFGNFLPVPFLLILLERLLIIAKKFKTIWKFYDVILKRVETKRRIVEKFGYFGLALFVAIPLPGTGAWTGCLLSFLLRLNILKSSVAIFIGILIAGLIVLIPIIGLDFLGLI